MEGKTAINHNNLILWGWMMVETDRGNTLDIAAEAGSSKMATKVP